MSRNKKAWKEAKSLKHVTSREGRVSRNECSQAWHPGIVVTSREGRVSRNADNEVCTLRHTLP